MILITMNKFKMKTLHMSILIVFAISLSAQDGRDRNPKYDREKLQAARIAFLTNRLDLTQKMPKNFGLYSTNMRKRRTL